VLPSLGESNPQIFTWRSFLSSLGLSQRGSGADGSPERLQQLEQGMVQLRLESDDVRELRMHDTVLLKPAQVSRAVHKFERFGMGPRFCALVCDELHAAVERRIAQLAKTDEWQEELLGLDIEEQMELFGETVRSGTEEELASFARRWAEQRFAGSYEAIENLCWLRIDRIGMRMLGSNAISAAEWLYLKLLLSGHGARDARYVIVDEVQDYTATQLMVLARYFASAHVLLLGDENQATSGGTASLQEMRDIFEETHGTVEYCELQTSYRSSPEITELFASLMPPERKMSLTSVRAPGVEPRLLEVEERDAYLACISSLMDEVAGEEGLTAIIVDNASRANWLARHLDERVRLLDSHETLPGKGIVLMELRLAKGLEFDRVIIADAQEQVYPDAPLARRRLYTAISRAMHQVTLVAQGPMTPLLQRA
jgi:DNA helicase-2/ATP-dependent DNA helicase PcrA